MLKDLILKNRSYRRFYEDVEIPQSNLMEMIDNARLSPSARNAQVLKYFISTSKELNEKIFSCLAWAGYLTNWQGPDAGERPSAYIVQLHDSTLSVNTFCDDGIAAQSIMLTAVEKGFGGCIIASVKREELSAILNLPSHLLILHVFALGKPKEEVRLEPMQNGDIKYWRDDENVHHVPKRGLDEIVYVLSYSSET